MKKSIEISRILKEVLPPDETRPPEGGEPEEQDAAGADEESETDGEANGSRRGSQAAFREACLNFSVDN